MKAAKTLSLGMILATAALGWPGQLGGQTKIEFEGNITAVSGTQIELFNGAVHFEARGARIETDDEEITNISDLKIGTAIEVEALLGAGDSIQATTLEVSDEKDQDSEVCGVIGIVDEAARTFTIGPISISWTGQTNSKRSQRRPRDSSWKYRFRSQETVSSLSRLREKKRTTRWELGKGKERATTANDG